MYGRKNLRKFNPQGQFKKGNEMNDKKSKWDEIRETGILMFVLSLPIMIWKSGHFGKYLTCLIMGLLFLFLAGRASDVIFSKFINRWEIRNESDRTLADIHKTKEKVDSVRNFLGGIDAYIRNKAEGKYQEIGDQYKSQLSGLDEEIEKIKSAVSVISESEQAGIKQRIIELNEEVKINKKSIDSKEIRTKFEDIFKNIGLLSADDKERFMHDLKEMGFYLEKSENRVMAYRSGYMAVSGDVVYPSFVSTDIVMIPNYSNNRDDR